MSLKTVVAIWIIGQSFISCHSKRNLRNTEQDVNNTDTEQGVNSADKTETSLLKWKTCKKDFFCSSIEVPIDYEKPEGKKLRIEMIKHPAKNMEENLGYLFVNPGGPGGSAIDLVRAIGTTFSQRILDRFDIIGFDPRGVGASEPKFQCGTNGEYETIMNRASVSTDTNEQLSLYKEAASLCNKSMGDVASFIHTDYVARDMEEIRKALGSDQISYVGYSYGSLIGVWYATLFPDAARAIIIDGAANPYQSTLSNKTNEEAAQSQISDMATYFTFLKNAVEACTDQECPIYNNGDPMGYFELAVQKLNLVNEAADHPSAGFIGIITTVIYGEFNWPTLWKGLYELQEQNDPSILLREANNQGLTKGGGTSITGHVNCLDTWALDPEGQKSAIEKRGEIGNIANQIFQDMFPNLTRALSFQNYFGAIDICDYFSDISPPPLKRPLDGSDVPIIVVGNTGDAATSYSDSKQLAQGILSNGYLIKVDHPRHGVYPSNNCVEEHVDNLLLGLTLPNRFVECEATPQENFVSGFQKDLIWNRINYIGK